MKRRQFTKEFKQSVVQEAKAGDILKRRTIDKLGKISQHGPKMVPQALPSKELEDEQNG